MADEDDPGAVIPTATYRLQFNRCFTLAQAAAIVPYLADLGISHCYSSPYLKARPNSTHGYDIVDHQALNPEIGAAMLRPFVSEELHWIANTHGVFQGYYFFHYIGADRDLRENYRGHPHFQACADFCEKYDQAAFDPAYDSAPLDFFVPMVGRVFARPINSIYAKAAAEAAA